MGDSLSDLEKELADKGAPTDFVKLGQKHSPLEALVNGGASGQQFTDILLDYLPKVDASSKEMIARALTVKGNTKATKPLLSLFRDKTLSDTNRWAVGNALSVINDKASYEEVFEICKQRSLGTSRQMLLDLVAKLKTEEAFQLLIALLKDKTVVTHAISALAKFGDTRAISFIEAVDEDNNSYIRKTKAKAVETLKKKHGM